MTIIWSQNAIFWLTFLKIKDFRYFNAYFSCSFVLLRGKNSAMSHFYTSFIMVSCQWVFGREHDGFQEVMPHFLAFATLLCTFSCISTTWWLHWDQNTKSIFGGSDTWQTCKWFNSWQSLFMAFNSYFKRTVNFPQHLVISSQLTLYYFLSFLRNFTSGSTFMAESPDNFNQR